MRKNQNSKWNLAVIVTATVCLGMSSAAFCGEEVLQETEKETYQENVQDTEQNTEAVETVQNADDIMHQIFEANRLDALIKNHTNVACNTIFYDQTGAEVASNYLYGDADRYVGEDSDSNVSILGNQDEYGFDSGTMTAYHVLFMDGTYDDYNKETRDYLFMDDWEDAEPDALEQNGDILIVEIVEDGVSIKEGNPDLERIQAMADTDSLVFQYQVDAATLELQKIVKYYETEEGVRSEEEVQTFSYDVTPYEPSQELLDAVFGDDCRTVTIIADPGTEQEKTYVQTVTKGNQVLVLFAEGYDTFYLDADCTQEKEQGNDLNADATYYMKKE